MKCGLLGKKLSHSYSPQIHSYLGEYDYTLEEVQPEKLKDFFAKSDFAGLNVTIPYKKDVIPFCDELTDCARKMGAVNTIVRREDGRMGQRAQVQQGRHCFEGKRELGRSP